MNQPSNSIASDLIFLKGLTDTLLTEPPAPSIVEWIEEHRIMPPGTPFPGPWRFSNSPYLREIQECFRPFSGIEIVAVMKAAQLGITELMLNCIAYYIDQSPCPILYISSTDRLLSRFGRRLEPMIDSCGIRSRFMAPIYFSNANTIGSSMSRQSGDKYLSKTFPGGSFDTGTLNSLSSLRSDSCRVLLLDEIDSGPLDTPEGPPDKIATNRTNAYGHSKKIFYVSTPGVEERSVIAAQYRKGDQRKFFVPCPHCNDPIELSDRNLEKRNGVVVYSCQLCGSDIDEHQKYKMMQHGEWKPTAEPSSKAFRSYHLSALYALKLPWDDIYEERLEAETEGDRQKKSYYNLKLGLPYKEIGERPDAKTIQRSTWAAEVIPDFVLFTTMAVDVQRGGKYAKPRLALNVVGHGSRNRKAVIKYEEIIGSTDDPFRGAWQILYDRLHNGHYTYKRSDDKAFLPWMCGIDCSDQESVVLDFCRRCPEPVFPVRGRSIIGTKATQQRYNWTGRELQINITLYKEDLYSNVKVMYDPDLDFQNWGYISFHKDLPDEYFKMLCSEEKTASGVYERIDRKQPNEALDVFVYANAVADFRLVCWSDERNCSIPDVLRQLHKEANVPCDL